MVDQAYYDLGARWDYFRWNVKYDSWDNSLKVLEGVPKSRIGTYTTWDTAEWDTDIWDGTSISIFEFYIKQGIQQVAQQDPPNFEDAVKLMERFAPPSFTTAYVGFENQTTPSFTDVVTQFENVFPYYDSDTGVWDSTKWDASMWDANIKSQTIEKAVKVMENR